MAGVVGLLEGARLTAFFGLAESGSGAVPKGRELSALAPCVRESAARGFLAFAGCARQLVRASDCRGEQFDVAQGVAGRRGVR